MNSNILGQYGLRGKSSVNIAGIHHSGIDKTIVHESSHLLLTQRTTYGIFQHILLTANIFPNENNKIKKSDIVLFLSNYSRLAQESVATFIEHCSIYKINGKNAFDSKLRILKEFNADYYRYYDQLSFIFNYSDDIDEIMYIATMIGLYSMSANLIELHIDILANEKKRKAFFKDGKNCNKYLPDTRFKKIVKIVQEYLENNGINEEMFSWVECEFKNNYGPIYEPDEDFVTSIKKYFKSIYKNSKFYNEICKRLDSITSYSVEEFDIRSTIPTVYHNYPMENVDIDKIYDKTKEGNGINFLIGNVKGIQKILKNTVYIPSELIENISSQIIFQYSDFIDKKNYAMLCNKEQINLVLKETNSLTVVSFDLFLNSFESIFDEYKIGTKKIFIYSDKSIINISKDLKKLSHNSLKVTFVEYNNMSLMIVKLKDELYYIQPIVKIFLSDIYIKIFKKEINLEFSEIIDEETCYDSYIIKSQDDLDEIDFLVNCLFNL